MYKNNFIKILYILLFYFVSLQLVAFDVFCQSCSKVVEINKYGYCPFCNYDLTPFLVGESFIGLALGKVNICYSTKTPQDCDQKDKIPLEDFHAKKAIIRIKELLPGKQRLTIKESVAGLDLTATRKKIKRELKRYPDLTQEALNQIIIQSGFHHIPVQGGLFYQNGTINLSRWISRQSEKRVLNLLFIFISEDHYEGLVDDYHLVFVHIEGSEATIVLECDHNDFITLHFTTEITDTLINEYFQTLFFSQLLVYHQDSHSYQKKKKRKKRK